MNEERKARKYLATRLGIKSVSDEMWHAIEALDPLAVEDALELGTESAFEELVDAARTAGFYKGIVKERPAPKRKKKPPMSEYEFHVSGNEGKRARAVAEYTALIATWKPEVKGFRKEILRDQLLSGDEAFQLVYSEAARRFSYKWFVENGVPLTDHNSEFLGHGFRYLEDVEQEDEYIYVEEEYEHIYVDPPGHRFEVWLPEPYKYFEDLPDMMFVPDLRKGRLSLRENMSASSAMIYPGSVIDELRIASIELEKYVAPTWNAGQSAWFILTGNPVVPPALIGESGSALFRGEDGTLYLKNTITLEIEPWVTAETVAKVYRELQLGVLGENPRSIGERNLAVFMFVTKTLRKRALAAQSRDESPHKPSWPELMAEWNESSDPQNAYTNYRNFNRDYHRAANKLLETNMLFRRLLMVPDQSEMLGD